MNRVRAALFAAAVLAGGSPVLPAPAAPAGRWVAGDLHVHTKFSRDVCSAPVMVTCDPDTAGAVMGSSPIELVRQAELRGLGFVSFTDHDVPSASQSRSAQNDPEIAAYKQCHIATPEQCPVLVIDGQERTLTDATGFPTGSLGVVGVGGALPDPTPGVPGWTGADVATVAGQVRQAGGLAFAFSPGAPSFAYDPASGVLDGFEIWSGAWIDQPEFLGPSSTDNPRADDAWQRAAIALASTGKRLAPLGGSDAHARASSGTDGLGQPSLWVFDALDPPGVLTWPGIRDGLQKGRTFVSFAPPSVGPRLFLETADGAFIAGDTVPKNPPTGNRLVRVRWENAPAGAFVRLFGSTSPSPPTASETGSRAIVLCDPPAGVDAEVLARWRCNGSFTLTLQFNAAWRWHRAEMYAEDAAHPQQGVAQAAPSRATAPCLPFAPAPGWSPCWRDRYGLLAVTAPLYSAL